MEEQFNHDNVLKYQNHLFSQKYLFYILHGSLSLILPRTELESEYKQQNMLAGTWQASRQYLVWKIGRKLPNYGLCQLLIILLDIILRFSSHLANGCHEAHSSPQTKIESWRRAPSSV
jgi:hypothetical protein